MIFDSHSHYDDTAFDEDRYSLLSSMAENNVGHIICVAAEHKSFKPIQQMCDTFSFCHPAFGIHPENATDLTPECKLELEKLLADGSSVAVGEIGLDYHYDEPGPDLQREIFIYQLELANKFDLPVIIHSRDAAEETMNIIKEHLPNKRGVIHCFSSSVEIAKEYVKMGFYIGIGGVVTFKNGKKLKEVAAEIPLSSILIETDCPYMAPVPYRGERNDSRFLSYVAEEIASLRGITAEEVINATEQNAKKLFNIN